jgi:hypothetical protein
MKKSLFFVSLLLASTISFSQIPNYVPTNGLVGWWPFNGNANDESGNGNNGIIYGANLSTDRFGFNNSSYSFNNNANSYIQVPNSPSINISGNQITISVWISSRNLPNDNKHKGISKGGWGSGSGYELLYRNTNAGDSGAVQLGGANGGLQSWANINGFDSNWFHLVGVFNNGSGHFYLNGVLLNAGFNGQKFNNFTPSNYPLLFGKTTIANSPLSGFVNGRMDDIGIWNRALTHEEVLNLFNAKLCVERLSVTDTLVININRTGYNPITYSNTIKVYPNPSNNQITIDNGDLSKMNGYSIKIINSLGQQLYQTAINQQLNTIDITQWGGNGMYYLQVIDANGNIIEIKKIILQ